jgi:alpha-galactosidase
MRHDDELERYRIPVNEYIRRSEENLVEFERVREALEAGEPMPTSRTDEYAATIVNSMVTGEPSVIYGNVPNTGLIPGLPEELCVEVPCVVERSGLHPTQALDYPAQLAALNRTYANVVELTVRAVLEERPDYVRIAALLDPNASATLTIDEIYALCDDLTLAHGDLIPAALRGEAVGAR